MKKTILIILTLMMSLAVHAKPVSGMWYSPDESGRGLDIEIHNGVLLTTFFGYNEDGAAQWWQGVATEPNPGSGVYTGSFTAAKDGQCPTCEYVAPVADTDNDLDQFTLSFDDSRHATLNWVGGEVSVVKYNYAFAEYLDYAYGILAFTAVEPQLGRTFTPRSRFFLIDDEGTDDEGRFLLGNWMGWDRGDTWPEVLTTVTSGVDDAGRDVLYFFTVDDDYRIFWELYADEDKFTGRVWGYYEDETMTGEGLVAYGFRMKDRYETEIDDTIKTAAVSGQKQTVQPLKMKASDNPAPARIVKAAARMERIVQSKRR